MVLAEIELWPRSRFTGRAAVVTTAGPDGRLEIVRVAVPDDTILCDFCNAEITEDPVPVLYGTHALCPACRAKVETDLTNPHDSSAAPAEEVCPLGTWQDFEDKLQAQFLERREVIHGLLVALVARQHVILIGPPGAPKSELARTVCGAVGGRFFRTTLTPTSTPDELLGPVSAKRLIEDDVIARNLDGSIATADIAAVDEVWKRNAATLNCLLSVLVEREITDAGKPVPLPLRTLVGTSNELPQEEGLTALWDRFALR